MKGKTILLRVMAVILTMGAGMNAEAGLFGRGGTSWKEEVVQPDGSTRNVERRVVRKGRHEIGQRPPIGEQVLSFDMPGTAERVEWEDPYSEELGGSSFNPMLIGVLGDAAYVLAAPAGCLSYNKWGRPNPPYVVFKYQNKEWHRISVQKLPAEFAMPNLIISSPDDVAEKIGKPVVSAEQVRQSNQGFQQPEYRAILREPLPNVWSSCGEMVYDGNGGWIGIGWFKDQPSYQACLKYCGQRKIGARYCPCETLFGGK